MPMLRLTAALLAALPLLLAALPAFAYIGPGAGITMLGALWGVVVAVLLALGAVLFWPIRALLRRRKPAATAATSAGATPVANASAAASVGTTTADAKR